jgi:hypothetical protein
MSNLIVVETCTPQCDVAAASATVTPSPASVTSSKVKCKGNKAYTTIVVSVMLSGYITTVGTFTGASTKVKGNNLAFVLANQTITVSLPIQPPATGPNQPVVVSFAKANIYYAGQTKVKAI